MNWPGLLVSVLCGSVLLYAVFLLALWSYARHNPGTVTMRDALRLLPDLIRVIRRLVVDRRVPVRARIKLALILAYLALPIDLVPDFIPLLGYADDVLVLAWGLRALIRDAGGEPLRRNWPGTAAGLAVIERLAGLPASASDDPGPGE
ncbi:YkvA family protein [Spelaeicoccus albus]|uniref:Uncharacterized membrane protein YkvA (DUF1232 family) n=1 Tax=Spelaeicoccus albus TaxID=1280376 RepID=A0A7Z0A864_9MICO|nr:DUF1232 domain-containing protein [Spelaeicoccus albus]NYI66209.1 uncharacterized membrane protein YkvA (DUF1232 family) [Spelaeicoccus albus]